MASVGALLAADPAALFSAADEFAAAGSACSDSARAVAGCAPAGDEWAGNAAAACSTEVNGHALYLSVKNQGLFQGAAAVRTYAEVVRMQQQVARAAKARYDEASALVNTDTGRLRAAVGAGAWSAVPALIGAVRAHVAAGTQALLTMQGAATQVGQAASRLHGELLGVGSAFDADSLVEVTGVENLQQRSPWDGFTQGVSEAVVPQLRGLASQAVDAWDGFWTLDPHVTPVDLDPHVMPAGQAVAPAVTEAQEWTSLLARDPARAVGQLGGNAAMFAAPEAVGALGRAGRVAGAARTSEAVAARVPPETIAPPLRRDRLLPSRELATPYWGEADPANPHRAFYPSTVHYMSPAELEAHRVVVSDGRLRWSNGQLLDTTTASSLHSGAERAIYVMDRHGNLYVSLEQTRGVLHHSSFLSGTPVAGAGELVVRDGVPELISRRSGHYLPTDANQQTVVNTLRRQGLDVRGLKREGF